MIALLLSGALPAGAQETESEDLLDDSSGDVDVAVADVAADGGPGDVIPEADQTAEVDAIRAEERRKNSPAPLLLPLLGIGALWWRTRRI